MKTAAENAFIKNDYEILFKDSPEYFVIFNAKMFQEGDLIRFISFNDSGFIIETHWYPIFNIHRIKTYKETKL